MEHDKIYDPEMTRIQNDEYYLLYEMLTQALRTDNVIGGLQDSLNLLKTYLSAENILLYKKSGDSYICKQSAASLKQDLKAISFIVNKKSEVAERKEKVTVDLNMSDNYRNFMLLHLKNQDNDYMLVLNNIDKDKKVGEHFWERVRESLHIIIKRAESYERNTRAIKIDLLTDLDNRNSYEQAISELDETRDDIVFGIFDLFRLKYINDNYNHGFGDEYIRKTAEILKKYWPKYRTSVNENGIEEKVETGHCVYRVGGDEFILITNQEDVELTKMKASFAAEEVAMLDLGIEEDLPLGLNGGIVKHKAGDSIKNTYSEADELMEKTKREMYQRTGIDRRK